MAPLVWAEAAFHFLRLPTAFFWWVAEHRLAVALPLAHMEPLAQATGDAEGKRDRRHIQWPSLFATLSLARRQPPAVAAFHFSVMTPKDQMVAKIAGQKLSSSQDRPEGPQVQLVPKARVLARHHRVR